VLLDVAACRGVAVLPEAYEVTPDDCETALARGGTELRPGDAVFVRTGWSCHFSDPARYFSPTGAPGPGHRAAAWLADHEILLTGSDTPAYEHRPSDSFPVHALLMIEKGIYIVEWMNLDPISQAGIYTFVSIIVPLKLTGASASPVRPVALK
jgi:kynurenine formamidase